MENNLKQIRNSKNLLQTKVAMDLNITQETISSYETGRVFPSSDMLIKLAVWETIPHASSRGRPAATLI